MRPATDREITAWDELISRNPDGGHSLQTRAWGEFKRGFGWRPRYVVAGENDELAILYLVRRVPGLGELWYAPKGPGISEPPQLLDAITDRSLYNRAFCVKFEPEIAEPCDTSTWDAHGLVKAAGDIQISRATIIIDIGRDDETLMASFKPKTRYNIRLAQRKGVRVQQLDVNDATVDVMYRLLSAALGRAGFPVRSRRYMEGYWRLQHACGQGDFFFASKDSEVLAGAFVTRFGTRAWYKDGGSTRRHQELMASHLLQWEVMRWLRDHGIRSYDLVAIPRATAMVESNPLFGLYQFKSGFGGTAVEFAGTWDWPLRATAYAAWNLAGERAMARLTRAIKHDLLY